MSKGTTKSSKSPTKSSFSRKKSTKTASTKQNEDKNTSIQENQKIIKIDGNNYSADGLNDAAKGALASLQFIDARLAALHKEMAINQTARLAYIKNLKSELSSNE